MTHSPSGLKAFNGSSTHCDLMPATPSEANDNDRPDPLGSARAIIISWRRPAHRMRRENFNGWRYRMSPNVGPSVEREPVSIVRGEPGWRAQICFASFAGAFLKSFLSLSHSFPRICLLCFSFVCASTRREADVARSFSMSWTNSPSASGVPDPLFQIVAARIRSCSPRIGLPGYLSWTTNGYGLDDRSDASQEVPRSPCFEVFNHPPLGGLYPGRSSAQFVR